MSDAKLEFTPVHRYLTVELPDKHRYQCRVNFAVMTFFTVAEICQELSIRHPEEMSLMKSPVDKEGYAKLTGWTKARAKKVCVCVWCVCVCVCVLCVFGGEGSERIWSKCEKEKLKRLRGVCQHQ